MAIKYLNAQANHNKKTQNSQNCGTDKGVQPKPLRRVWNREGDDPIVKGTVSGVEILLDTGAE